MAAKNLLVAVLLVIFAAALLLAQPGESAEEESSSSLHTLLREKLGKENGPQASQYCDGTLKITNQHGLECTDCKCATVSENVQQPYDIITCTCDGKEYTHANVHSCLQQSYEAELQFCDSQNNWLYYPDTAYKGICCNSGGIHHHESLPDGEYKNHCNVDSCRHYQEHVNHKEVLQCLECNDFYGNTLASSHHISCGPGKKPYVFGWTGALACKKYGDGDFTRDERNWEYCGVGTKVIENADKSIQCSDCQCDFLTSDIKCTCAGKEYAFGNTKHCFNMGKHSELEFCDGTSSWLGVEGDGICCNDGGIHHHEDLPDGPFMDDCEVDSCLHYNTGDGHHENLQCMCCHASGSKECVASMHHLSCGPQKKPGVDPLTGYLVCDTQCWFDGKFCQWGKKLGVAIANHPGAIEDLGEILGDA